MNRTLAGRTILLTGGSSGIGLAAARLLAGEGCRLFLISRDRTRLESATGNLVATLLQYDLSEPEQVRAMADAVARETESLDALINCAGQLEVGPAATLGFGTADRLMRINFLGAAAAIDTCLPLLRRGYRPVIVNVSSLASRVAPPYMAAYAASKFALSGYSHALRQELRAEGIHVGLVVPGPVDTPMVRGKLGESYFPLLPGVPVIGPDRVARAIVAVIKRRLPEVVLPGRLSIAARLASAFPGLVDLVYAATASRSSSMRSHQM